MTLRNLCAFAFISATLASPALADTIVQWTGTGANGHSYEAILAPAGITWAAAEADAVARGGYLATITSAAEDNFVFSLVAGNANFWSTDPANNEEGVWLGGYQPPGSAEPAGGWTWVTGETFSYTAWNPREPNDTAGTDNSLIFFGTGASLPTAPHWNDVSDSFAAKGYIIEYNEIPEPGTYTLLLAGLGVMGFVSLRRKAASRRNA